MRVGVPKEIKVQEYRVGLTPSSVREVVERGHEVLVERGAGAGIGAAEGAYEKAGARIVGSAEEVFAAADMIVKVKEPQAAEIALLRPGQILFTYLHLAPDPEQCQGLLASGAVCIAYETVTQAGGGLPLLAPMSEVAGRMAVHAGAHCLEKAQGGMGILPGGVAGVPPAKIVILGAGVVGSNAAQMAVGTGAVVVVIDRNTDALRRIDRQLGARVITVFSNRDSVEHHVCSADMVIGGVLIPGAAAPKLVSRALVGEMKPGAVVIDVAIDQGGCFETSRATTHDEPTFLVGKVVHYCVANMPGAVPRTSTYALNNATLPFTLQLAGLGWKRALAADAHLMAGLNVCEGKVTHREVAEALGHAFHDPLSMLS
ncbi:MAG TPA: alanine dehydrogenase [Usitatibacteraceae bacterium]|nr:alanine dehydrogenase [Usitatibacteraceae bacterium]